MSYSTIRNNIFIFIGYKLSMKLACILQLNKSIWANQSDRAFEWILAIKGILPDSFDSQYSDHYLEEGCQKKCKILDKCLLRETSMY